MRQCHSLIFPLVMFHIIEILIQFSTLVTVAVNELLLLYEAKVYILIAFFETVLIEVRIVLFVDS